MAYWKLLALCGRRLDESVLQSGPGCRYWGRGSVRVRRAESSRLTGWCDADFSWVIALSRVFGLHPEHRVERFYSVDRLSRLNLVDRFGRLDPVGRLSRLPGLRVLDRLGRQPRLGILRPFALVRPGLAVHCPYRWRRACRLSVPQGNLQVTPADGGSGADGAGYPGHLVDSFQQVIREVISHLLAFGLAGGAPGCRGHRRVGVVQCPGRPGGGIAPVGGKGQAVDNQPG